MVILDARESASEPGFAEGAHRILADVVNGGAALGWVEPPSRPDVAALIANARAAGIEVRTLDARGDNDTALRLYFSLDFTEYGCAPTRPAGPRS